MMTNMAIDAEVPEALLPVVFTAHQLTCEAGISLRPRLRFAYIFFPAIYATLPGQNDFELHFCYLLYYVRASVASSLLFMPLLPE